MGRKILTVALVILFVVILVIAHYFLTAHNSSIAQQMKNEKQELSNTAEIMNNISGQENITKIVTATSANFEQEVLKSDKTVLVDFYADWCEPCKMLAPIIEEIAAENEDIKVVKVDTEASQSIALRYQVVSIPTLVVIKNGEEIDRVLGYTSKSVIVDMLK